MSLAPPVADPTSRGTAAAFGLYTKEVSFYRELAPRLGVRVPKTYAAEVDDTGAESSWVTKIVMTPQYRTNGVSFCVRYDLPNFPRLYPKHSPFSLQRKIGTLISRLQSGRN